MAAETPRFESFFEGENMPISLVFSGKSKLAGSCHRGSGTPFAHDRIVPPGG